MADGVSGNSPVNQSAFATTVQDRVRILETYKRIAMVGLSSNPFRPSHFAAIYMLAHGYDVTPVNPRKSAILGRTCYASLRDVPGPIEILEQAAQRARGAGLEVVMDRCVKIEHARFFGGLSTIGLNTGIISALKRKDRK
jgi:predicted CoA-binding protein